MKIKPSKRVKYDNNPLIEVLCQVRFDRISELEHGGPEAFQRKFAHKYPKPIVENVATFQVVIGGGQPLEGVPQTTSAPIHHFLSEDQKVKVSVNAEFVTFSCEEYGRWEDFKRNALEAIEGFLEIYPQAVPRRIGLRYKDLIVRERLGLTGRPWSELVTPFVAGIFAVDDFFEAPPTVDDEAHIQQASQATLQLDECGLLVQSAMLKSADGAAQSAFLIDSDFFRESPKYGLSNAEISNDLEALHANADALFRRCITKVLHDALGPNDL